MKSFRIIIIYAIFQFVQPGAFSQDNVLSLLSNGSSQFVVVLNQKSSAEEERAASVLRYFFKRVTDFNLPVSKDTSFQYKFLIVEDTTLPGQGFSISAVDKYKIILRGGKNNGVVNASWFFLRNYCGIDYLTSNNVYSVHKETIKINVPILIRQQPSFETRMLYSLEGFDFDYTEAHSLELPFSHHYDFAHTFQNDLLPAKLYFKSHPEYYITYHGKPDSSQPNLLHPDVFNVVLSNLKKKIRQDTLQQYHYYSISLNDNPLISEDAETAKILAENGQNYTSILLAFVNRIADSIPDKNFTTLAYEQTKSFPKSIVPRKNVTIILTNADNDKSKTLYSDDLDYIQKLHMKNQIPLWLSVDSDLIFWDYIPNYTNSLMPWPNLFTIKPNFQFYKKLGIKHLFVQNVGRILTENSELKAFLCANLMWNVDYNDDSLIRVFCQQYYQNSWKTMYEYIAGINKKALNGNDKLFTYDGPVKFKNTLFQYNNVVKWIDMLKTAELQAGDDNLRKRILKERLGLDQVFLELSANVAGWNKKEDKKDLYNKLDEFKRDCKMIGISRLNASEGSLENFIQNTQSALH